MTMENNLGPEDKMAGSVQTPIWFELTPNGKTLVAIYANHEKLADACIKALGEPEYQNRAEEDPNTLLLLFPHQDMPDDLKDIAEHMTSETLIECLEKGIPITER